uniref:NADH-ubiquinone oxidoreductase chain 4 n=1 Tax=Ampittia dioscorides TaxID=509334 RepID=A0A097KZH6_9NEOP|nr:NADH dehydrogense subunit 4 [Ampittia dioscorides]
MMKIFFFLLFKIPLCFKKNMFWSAQKCLFFMKFMFMNFMVDIMNYCNLTYMFGYDLISFGLGLLKIWICSLMMLPKKKLYKFNFYVNFFMFKVLLLLLLLLLTFSTMNLFMFYLFFEGKLIPTLLLIVGWGYQPERIQAGLYLLFYTLFVSLPLLLGIFFIFNEMNCMVIYFLKFFDLNFYVLYFSMIMALLVKMPMYFTHLWLPKAHVEAPVSGSMILAGIMLNQVVTGYYGFLILFWEIYFNLNFIWVMISLIGGFLISLNCFCQTMSKSLIAYSSVAHMSLVICGIMTMNYWGLFSFLYYNNWAWFMFISDILFSLNMNYERFTKTKFNTSIKGIKKIFLPSMSLWWFLLLSSSMAAPPSMNLMGEISLINSLLSWSWLTMIMLMMITFLSAGYSLYLYSYTQHGNYNFSLYSFYMGLSREFLLLMLHWLPLNMMILKIDYFMIWF